MRFINLRKSIASILVISTSSLTVGNFAPPASAQGLSISKIASNSEFAVYEADHRTRSDGNALRSAFTQEFVREATQNYPNYNVVISHNPSRVAGIKGKVIHQHVQVGTIGYEVYMAPKGTFFKFVLNGDAGFINWAYAGNFRRNGNLLVAN